MIWGLEIGVKVKLCLRVGFPEQRASFPRVWSWMLLTAPNLKANLPRTDPFDYFSDKILPCEFLINLVSCYKSNEYIDVIRGAANEYLLPQTLQELGLSPPGPILDRCSILGLPPLSRAPVLATCWGVGLNVESVRTFTL